MPFEMSRSQTNKIGLIILFMSICIPLLLFNGTLDDFVPYHIATVEETVTNGKMIEKVDQVVQVPGFYILGAQILLITEFEPVQLISYPIQLIPYALIIFTLLYVLSHNAILAGLVTFIEMCSGTAGTGKIFFWPHGIGYILFFSILLLIFILLKGEKPSKTQSSIFLLAVIMGCSLVYISYNLTAMSMIFLSMVLIIQLVHQKLSSRGVIQEKIYSNTKSMVYGLFLIMSIVVFGLSKFVYGVFIPTLRAAQEFQMSSIDKFLISFMNAEQSTTPLSPIMISYPESISIISGIKYSILFIIIIIFCMVILKQISNRKSISYLQIFSLAIFLMSIIYAVPRLMIGGIIISALWLPGIFMIFHFYQLSKKYKVWAIAAVALILSCTLLYFCVMDNNGYINRDNYQFGSYQVPTAWFISFNNGDVAVSDELTNDFFILYSLEYSINHGNKSPSVDLISGQHKILPQEDVLKIVQLSDGTLDSKYYILNERLTRMSLQSWIIIESWTNSNEHIHGNDQIDKIYHVPLLSIYYSS